MNNRLKTTLGSFLVLMSPLLTPVASSDEFAYADAGTLAYLVVSIGLSLLAGALAKKKSPITSDKPSTLASRGDFISWHVGTRRLGPVICWVGDREIRKEHVDGGKGGIFGGGGTSRDVFHESAFHALCVGPAHSLFKIYQNGKVIFDGEINADSHPSGTTFDLGFEGAFTILWGEEDQPISGFLGDPSRVGVSSRWPFVCYIIWDKKRLGSSAVWPTLHYVIERRPVSTLLTQSSSFYNSGFTPSGVIYSVGGIPAVGNTLSSADQDVGYISVRGEEPLLRPGSQFELINYGLPDGLYQVLRIFFASITTGTDSQGHPIQVLEQRMNVVGGTLGVSNLDPTRTLEPYDKDDTNGGNPAHAIAEMLFSPFPQGMTFDPDHVVESWDLQSLEDFGIEAEADGWRSDVLASEGKKVSELLGSMLVDHVTMLTLDHFEDGALSFKSIREPVGNLVHLPSELTAGSLPEIETNHDDPTVDRVIFKFTDKSTAYGDMTIVVDNDAAADFSGHQRSRDVQITSTTLFDTAAKLAELRSPEEMSQGAEFRLEFSRGARDLVPGQAFTTDNIADVLRVTSVGKDTESEKVEVRVIPDFFGVPKSSFVTGEGAEVVDPLAPLQDLAISWMEVPGPVHGVFPSNMILIPLHIRAHSQISFSTLYLSQDDITYTLSVNDTFFQTGGSLTEALTSDGPQFMVQGPVYEELGPDNSTGVQDLSADLTNWGAGRQMVVITSVNGREICFLQKALITGATTRRLDGLLRSRYNTRRLDHPIGASVFIFDIDNAFRLQDTLIAPNVDFYLKTQPGTTGGQSNLSASIPYVAAMYGHGLRPVRPDYLYVQAPALGVPAFQTGDDITLSWAISTGSYSTGAGGQPAGQGIAVADLPGTVQIEFLTLADVSKLIVGLDATDISHTITNAELVAAFTSEPTSFKVRIFHIANGRTSSASEELTITRI